MEKKHELRRSEHPPVSGTAKEGMDVETQTLWIESRRLLEQIDKGVLEENILKLIGKKCLLLSLLNVWRRRDQFLE